MSRGGIYVASRVARAPMWLRLREAGVPINSTWIDEAGDGDTPNFAELWERIRNEIDRSAALIFYAGPDDFPLKGAYVEVGMALALRVPVYVVLDNVPLEGRTMRPVGSWILADDVTCCTSVSEAVAWYQLATASTDASHNLTPEARPPATHAATETSTEEDLEATK